MTLQLTKKAYYEKNEPVINDPTVNITFDQLLDFTDEQYVEWMTRLMRTIRESWDTYGNPARSGKTEHEMIRSFNKLATYPVREMIFTDELNEEHGVDAVDDVIYNVARKGTEVDQFFPAIMKARINYTSKDTGYSVYDMLADEKYHARMIKGGRRHFVRDSFYHYSNGGVKVNDTKSAVVLVKTGMEWINAFNDRPQIFKGYDFWLQETEPYDKSTGYFPVEWKEFVNLSANEVRYLWDAGKLTKRNVRNIDIDNLPNDVLYRIRVFKLGSKMFPKAFIAFKIGHIQVAVNFPPMTAKTIYERFTDHLTDKIGVNVPDKVIIYDPSSGWGGRMLGALSVVDDRSVHYIGVDPNPQCWDLEDGKSRYEALADFYNSKTYRGNEFLADNMPTTFELFQDGSECVHLDPRFQKYKGRVDLVFTSPPYFNREAYGEDERQSYKKFPGYEEWKEGYLRRTLQTAVEYLRPGCYLIWNIADLLQGKHYLPLEEDSRQILRELGMVTGSEAPGAYKQPDVLKMAMQSMPGQHRLNADGTPKAKNFCKINGQFYKYEPIFVYWKPLDTK